jgi:hypothetical protein
MEKRLGKLKKMTKMTKKNLSERKIKNRNIEK